MDRFLDDLFAKRSSVREEALSSIVDGLNFNYRSQFAEKNFATLLYRCLNSFKKGSSKEIALAARAIGLLSITIGCGDNSEELYRESIPLIQQALKSKSESLLLSAVDFLAVSTFVGANDFEQTEASMQILWHFIHSIPTLIKTNSIPTENVAVKKLPMSVLSAAISAWLLLLTTVDSWNLNHNYWQGAISYFLDLLEVDDQSVCMPAVVAIALICEVGCLEKFAGNITTDKISCKEKGKNISDHDYYSIQQLQEIISNHANRLLRETSLHSAATKTENGWNNFSMNILEVLKDGRFRQTSLKIGRHSLQLRSLSQLLQVNFIKRFLGRGFVPHMLENEFLHDVFNFTPRQKLSGNELYVAEREEVTVHVFVPEPGQRDCEVDLERTQRPNRSAIRKAKTQLLNKHRMLKGEELRPYDD